MNDGEFINLIKPMILGGTDIGVLPNVLYKTFDENISFGKEYANCFVESVRCPHGRNHYVELEYPFSKGLDFSEEKKIREKFYASPDNISGSNRFSGIFLVSFLKAPKDFFRIKGPEYWEFIQFMKERNCEIKFVLLLSPEINESNFVNDIKYFSSIEVVMGKCEEKTINYLMEKIKKEGLYVSPESLKDIKLLPENIDTFIQKIKYYSLTHQDSKEINIDALTEIVTCFDKVENNTIGFRRNE